jgi:hypothetical protein
MAAREGKWLREGVEDTYRKMKGEGKRREREGKGK